MATLQQLETALQRADAAGNVEDAQKLAAAIQSMIKPVDAATLPEFGTIDGNNALFGSYLGDEETGVGQIFRDSVAQMFTLKPEARLAGARERFPELEFEEFGGDNAIITNPRTGGKAILNAFGASSADVAPIVGGVISTLPAGKAYQMAGGKVKGVAAAAATETVADAGIQANEMRQDDTQEFNLWRSGGVLGGSVLLGGTGAVIANKISKNAELKRILNDNPDSRTAGYVLNGAGKVQRDKVAQEALKQGFDPGVVVAVKGASKTDKRKMLKMLDVHERGRRSPTYLAKNRPTDIVGNSLMERFQVVQAANRQAGSQLDRVAKGLKGKTVDVSEPVEEFITNLRDKLGVDFDPQTLKPNYAGSDIEGLDAPIKVIDRLVNRMKNTSNPSAYDVHRLKRYIDENVSFGKMGEGLSGKTEGVLKSLRRGLDQLLDSNFPEYDSVNSVYAQTKTAMDNFQSAAGTTLDLSSPNASKAVGTAARRVLSNTQSRARILDSIQELQDVSLSVGGQFDDDLVTQVVFADELAKAFGSPARTSLAGEVEKGVQQAGRARNAQGVQELVISGVAKVADKARGINEEAAVRSLRLLLSD